MKKIHHSFNNFDLKIRIILQVLFLSSILSITINPLLAINIDGSTTHHSNDRVLTYPEDNNGKLYCKALSYIKYDDIFYQPVISKLPCDSKAYVEILCREDQTFNKKDYIILSCFHNNRSLSDTINPNNKNFSTCSVVKKETLIFPDTKIPNNTIKCDYINSNYKNTPYYLNETFYINRVIDY